MATMNRCEAEIDSIRIKLYEQTKHMTATEHTRWSNERAQRLAAQFGFKIGQPSSQHPTVKSGGLQVTGMPSPRSAD